MANLGKLPVSSSGIISLASDKTSHSNQFQWKGKNCLSFEFSSRIPEHVTGLVWLAPPITISFKNETKYSRMDQVKFVEDSLYKKMLLCTFLNTLSQIRYDFQILLITLSVFGQINQSLFPLKSPENHQKNL